MVADVAASFVAACMDVLCAKIRRALEEFGDPALAIVGGVAASPILRRRAQALADEFGSVLLIPPQALATDNAAMIGIAGWQKFAAHGSDDLRFGPQPDLRLTFADRGRGDGRRSRGSTVRRNGLSVEPDDVAVLVDVDLFGRGTRGQAGHGPHVPAHQVDETGAHVGPGLPHREAPAGRRTLEGGIRRDRKMRLGDADGKVAEAGTFVGCELARRRRAGSPPRPPRRPRWRWSRSSGAAGASLS